MATYATYAELVQRYGTTALAAMIPSDVTDPLATLAGQVLVEGAAEIDASLGACGYVTPVDTSAITDSDQQARAVAMLRRIEIGLAVSALSREFSSSANVKKVSTPADTVEWRDQVRADTGFARGTLEALCSKRIGIPGVSIPGRTFIKTSGAAVPNADDVDDRLAQAGAW